jgi:hypothetical protein
MKIFKKISISLILFTFFFMKPIKVFAGTAAAVNYINTVYALMLCASGSSLTDCSNPVILNETSDGTDMNIGGVDAGASAGAYGNLSVIPKGTTYTHGQVVLDRIFTVSGSDGSCQTGGAAGTAGAWGVGTSGSGTTTNQVIWASNGTGMSTSMNSSSHKDETATDDSTDGELANGDQYMKFRWALAKPYTYDGVRVPKMTIAFDLSAALNFNGDCGGEQGFEHGVIMSAPTITNTIE